MQQDVVPKRVLNDSKEKSRCAIHKIYSFLGRAVKLSKQQKVTVYVPGTRFMIEYCPTSFVITVRVCSMSAGLDASTVTPGQTALLGSVTAPDITWANPVNGCIAHSTITRRAS
jgi:hypothetical protein